MINQTISNFKILKKLGEGGMGVVYKAKDTKLERTVAIKFLPHEVAAQDDVKKRFKIEAKAAAALNHPNIATIHQIEEVDDKMFIVMEYVEGQELRQLVKTLGSVPIDDAITYAIQIAEGLQAAHKKGVIHRDIKSANIMLTENGQVKIMDFGLAKLSGQTQLTQEGMTLGTIAYM
ncbi:serine/threonine protein kinase, partial [candidate division KSB1 bacterium]|nr:serine/threonine protein kinase [candidate division KSB1 bacterium]